MQMTLSFEAPVEQLMSVPVPRMDDASTPAATPRIRRRVVRSGSATPRDSSWAAVFVVLESEWREAERLYGHKLGTRGKALAERMLMLQGQ